MNRIESNVYLIENLGELDCNYWLHKVRGLSADLDDYQKNIFFYAAGSAGPEQAQQLLAPYRCRWRRL